MRPNIPVAYSCVLESIALEHRKATLSRSPYYLSHHPIQLISL
jgi:hypothetical protein